MLDASLRMLIIPQMSLAALYKTQSPCNHVKYNLLYHFLCLSFILVVDNCLNELIIFIKHLSQTQVTYQYL